MIIFDVDGTLRDASHRLHFIQGEKKDWDGFYMACGDDEPIRHMINTMKQCILLGHNVMLWSGCSDIARNVTVDWFLKENIAIRNDPYSMKNGMVGDYVVEGLWMRNHGDFTKDEILKRSWLEHYRVFNPDDPITMTFDDRQRVVNMWRSEGILCVQVAPGDF